MLFNAPIFVFVYLPLVWVVYLGAIRLPWSRAGITWLAAASLFFYGYWNPVFVPLLLASIAFNYVLGRLLSTTGGGEVGSVADVPRGGGLRQKLLVLALAWNLILLIGFKYANFLAGTAASLTGTPARVFDIVLPLGISFYTFTQIAYLVDVYRSGRAERSLLAYVLFVTFFPHLVAGPVLHHSEMMPQFRRRLRDTVTYATVLEGLAYFTCGMAKKVIVADSVALAANRAFLLAEQHTLGLLDSWFGALAYTVQIYFDFSGYSDMAIGLALMLGIQLPLNFDSPYRCRSIIDFWRCWHMTLSRFLRDYLYIPLGGSRCGPVRRQLNLVITMLLGGLWHGASWNFVVWGGLHGLYLQANHLWRYWLGRHPAWTVQPRAVKYLAAGAAWLLTFLAVVVAWVFFRAESFTAAGNLLRGMFLGTASLQADLWEARTGAYVVLGLVIALFARNSQQLIGRWTLPTPGVDGMQAAASRRLALRQGLATGVLLSLVLLLTLISASWGTHEFIYFNF